MTIKDQYDNAVTFECGLNYVTYNNEPIDENTMLCLSNLQEIGTLKQLRSDRRNQGTTHVYSQIGYLGDVRNLKGKVFFFKNVKVN